jgi:type II secretory pathway pseudopilin PulG
MKGRSEQPKTSGISLIEVIAVVSIFFIVSASVQIVSNGRTPRNGLHRHVPTTNQLERDFHAPNDVIHTYAPGH